MYLQFAALWLVPMLSITVIHCAASGLLPRNQIAGIRIPSVMASDTAWRAGHRAAIPVIWLTAPVALAGTVVAAMIPNPGLAGLPVLASCALSIAILIRSAVVANRAARRAGGA
ncbi:hypothetical protein Mkiyose1088_24440 [Mycobacterium kiyosense]|nr:hypothetical protein Mkiyose1088_24440 [Mycobacterium kiyosense]